MVFLGLDFTQLGVRADVLVSLLPLQLLLLLLLLLLTLFLLLVPALGLYSQVPLSLTNPR